MTENEVRAIIAEIQAHAAQIGNLLNRLQQASAHRIMGFASWKAFLQSEYFSTSARHLQRLQRTAHINDMLVQSGNQPLREYHVRVLAGYPEHMQLTIAQAAQKTAEALHGKPEAITSKEIRAAGDALVGLATSGAVDDGSGSSVLLSAITMEAQEIAARQIEHINTRRGMRNERYAGRRGAMPSVIVLEGNLPDDALEFEVIVRYTPAQEQTA